MCAVELYISYHIYFMVDIQLVLEVINIIENQYFGTRPSGYHFADNIFK